VDVGVDWRTEMRATREGVAEKNVPKSGRASIVNKQYQKCKKLLVPGISSPRPSGTAVGHSLNRAI